MPLVQKRNENELWSEENISSAENADFISVWRWSATNNHWIELSSDIKDWLRFKLCGKSLPDVPAGPTHFVALVLTENPKAVGNIIPHFYIVGDDGRIAAYVDLAPELKPRYDELMGKRRGGDIWRPAVGL